MMLTATVTPAGDAVALLVTGHAIGTALALTRRDRNGVRSVRLAATTDATAATVAVTDFEGALEGPVRYLAADPSGSALADVTMPGTAGPQLRRTHRPTVAALWPDPVAYVADAPSTRVLRRSEHQVVGRDDTLYTTGRLGLRRGQLTVACPTLTAARAVREVYGAGQVVRLRAVGQDGLDMDHLGLSVALAPIGDQQVRWTVTVDYAEVRPSATRTLAPWSVAELAGTFATAAEVGLTFLTVADLRDNVRPEQL